MLVKLILISAIFSFVFVRGSESRGIEILSLVGEPYSDTDMDAEAANTQDQIVLEVPPPPTSSNLSPRSAETGSVHDHASYRGTKHPKKRATNYKDDRQADPLPGCCG